MFTSFLLQLFQSLHASSSFAHTELHSSVEEVYTSYHQHNQTPRLRWPTTQLFVPTCSNSSHFFFNARYFRLQMVPPASDEPSILTGTATGSIAGIILQFPAISAKKKNRLALQFYFIYRWFRILCHDVSPSHLASYEATGLRWNKSWMWRRVGGEAEVKPRLLESPSEPGKVCRAREEIGPPQEYLLHQPVYWRSWSNLLGVHSRGTMPPDSPWWNPGISSEERGD